jgi:hypothetical protein
MQMGGCLSVAVWDDSEWQVCNWASCGCMKFRKSEIFDGDRCECGHALQDHNDRLVAKQK